MSQRDLVAELRAARVAAPPEVRERVRLVADSAPVPPKRFTWRRALVLAVPVAAAIAASVVFTRPSDHPVAERQLGHGAATAPTRHAPAAFGKSADSLKAFSIAPARGRAQVYSAALGLRVRDVSDAIKNALRITTSLSGYALSVHAHDNVADLTLRVPRTHVQEALTRLSKLGTISTESVDIADKTVQLNATDRLIARLQAELKTAPPDRAAVLTARIQALQRQEAATLRATHFSTIRLHLAKPGAAVKHHGHGPLHGIGVALRWLAIGALYALAIGGPVAVLLALVFFAARLLRRRREEALLSSR